MKVLFITGDEHAFMRVEQDFGLDNIKQMAEENGGTVTINNETIYAEASILEFGEVCPKFIEFIDSHLVDYDDTKATDYWIIEE